MKFETGKPIQNLIKNYLMMEKLEINKNFLHRSSLILIYVFITFKEDYT